MLQLNNDTHYQTESAILLDLDGSEIWVVAVKATFDIRNGNAVLSENQEPVCAADEYYGEPGASSLKYENELVFRKPGTDIIVNGHAYAPKASPVKKLDVGIKVKNLSKTIRVIGNRVWFKSIGGLAISDAVPFTKIPIQYEYAFGGIDISHDNPKKHGAEERNPIGRGFGLSSDFLSGKPLPNLEDPSNEITGPKDRPQPVGFGFICRYWQPRIKYAGTYDQKWMDERLPLYPIDFDLRYFLGAQPDMSIVPHLTGGEPVELQNMTPEGRLAFNLPKIALGFRTNLGDKWIDHFCRLGTVIIEPDFPRLMMIFHTLLPCHRKKFDLIETEIFEKTFIS